MNRRPSLAVWKFSSCDGCQLTLLDCEDELMEIVSRFRVARFGEMSRAVEDGPYDVSLVEGSVTTTEEVERIAEIRASSDLIVTVGACAAAGGIQALRNFAAAGEYASIVYAHPEYLSSLDRSSPISEHVTVDLELHGCPIDRAQLVEVLTALLAGRRPVLPSHSVCQECKARATVCLLVAEGTPCLGPITRAGCGALCPALRRGCFGCFGPTDNANVPAILARLHDDGMTVDDGRRILRTFNSASPLLEGPVR